MKRMLRVEAWFDLICPWCLIGRRHLARAIRQFQGAQPDVKAVALWRSHPLLPATPAGGIPYDAFYLQRLGSREAVAARRAQVQEAGRAAGVEFAFDRIGVLPSTLAAHRLIAGATRQEDPARREALIDALFAGYFLRGENIGDPQVLARIAVECGFREELVAPWLDSPESREVSPGRHVPGVPYYVFNNRLAVSGAHPPQALIEAMERALPAREMNA